MRPGLGRKVFDKRSDQKSKWLKGAKNETSRLENKFYFETSEDNRNGLMVPLQS